MRLMFIATASVLALSPVVAQAQVSAQERMDQMQLRGALAEQQRRNDEVERRVDTLDLRMRTQETQRDLQAQSVPPPTSTQPWIAPAAPASPRDLAEAEARRQAALDASNARLKALSDSQGR